jgi:hypothetical protein
LAASGSSMPAKASSARSELFETREQGKESSRLVATWIRDEKLDTMIPNEPKITVARSSLVATA